MLPFLTFTYSPEPPRQDSSNNNNNNNNNRNNNSNSNSNHQSTSATPLDPLSTEDSTRATSDNIIILSTDPSPPLRSSGIGCLHLYPMSMDNNSFQSTMFSSISAFFQRMKQDSLWVGWNISASVTVLLPLFIMMVARMTGYNEEDDNNNNNGDDYNNQNYNNNNNNNNNNNHWWNSWYSNRSNNYNYNNDNQDEDQQGSNDATTPWWWFWSGEDREPDKEGSGALLFVYVWTLLLFVIMVIYGNIIFRRESMTAAASTMSHNNNNNNNNNCYYYKGEVETKTTAKSTTIPPDSALLRGAVIMFANLAFLILVLVTGLGEAIQTEGREVEENGGWYGQFGLCIFGTCLFWMIWSCAVSYSLRQRYSAPPAGGGRDAGTASGSYYIRQFSDWIQQPVFSNEEQHQEATMVSSTHTLDKKSNLEIV